MMGWRHWRNKSLPLGGILLVAALNHAASAADVSASSPTAMPVKAQVQSLDQRWQATFNEETQYYSWESSQGYPHLPLQFPAAPRGPGSGSQVYTPFGLQIDGKPSDDWQLQFLVRSGYIWSQQTTGGVSGENSSPTDTTFGGTVTYNGLAGLQPFASINVNAPTGKTVLLGNNAFARPDPDLAAVPTFGEGWNVGPTVGVNIPITATLVGVLSAGYTNRGDYTREGLVVLGVQGTNRITPGNSWTANTALAYQANGLSLQGSGSYTRMSQTSVDGMPIYRTGDSMTVSGMAGYVWNPSWSSQFTVSLTHTDKNLAPNPNPPPTLLLIEAFNSNSNITQALFSTTYTQGSFSIGPTVRYTYRDHNDWDPTSATFLPAKTSWAAGGMAQYVINPQASLMLRAEHRWTHENDNPDKLIGLVGPVPGTGFPAISSTGWMASLGGTIKF
jgi:hypothetical protein